MPTKIFLRSCCFAYSAVQRKMPFTRAQLLNFKLHALSCLTSRWTVPEAVSCSSAAVGMTNLKEFGDHLLSNQGVAACQPTADQPLQTKTYIAVHLLHLAGNQWALDPPGFDLGCSWTPKSPCSGSQSVKQALAVTGKAW